MFYVSLAALPSVRSDLGHCPFPSEHHVLCVPRSTSLSPIGPWSLPFSFGTLVETLPTM